LQRIADVSWPNCLNENLRKLTILKSNLETIALAYRLKKQARFDKNLVEKACIYTIVKRWDMCWAKESSVVLRALLFRE